MTVIRCMRFACWISRATGTLRIFLILIAFTGQQWLRERASVLRYGAIACLVRGCDDGNKRHLSSEYHLIRSRQIRNCSISTIQLWIKRLEMKAPVLDTSANYMQHYCACWPIVQREMKRRPVLRIATSESAVPVTPGHFLEQCNTSAAVHSEVFISAQWMKNCDTEHLVTEGEARPTVGDSGAAWYSDKLDKTGSVRINVTLRRVRVTIVAVQKQ